jgi:hypothetical protein
MEKQLRTDLSLQDIIFESWSAMEAMRRLGFPAGDLYMVDGVIGAPGTMYEGESCAGVLLRQGQLDFIFTVAPVKSMSIYSERWKRFCEAVNDKKIAVEDLLHIYSKSYCGSREAELAEAIRAKGIVIPNEREPS